jgi:hypothetical protein
MNYRTVNFVFGWFPFCGNAVLAFVAYYWTPLDFTQSLTNCNWTIIAGFAAAMASLLGFTVKDIGPRRTLFAVLGQSPALILIFAGVYRGQGLVNSATQKLVPLVDDFITPVYFSIVTWTTLGYGDFIPPEGLRWIAALEALIGYGFFGLLVGLGTYLLSIQRERLSPGSTVSVTITLSAEPATIVRVLTHDVRHGD